MGKLARVKKGRTDGVPPSARLFLFRCALMRRVPRRPRGFIELGFHNSCVGELSFVPFVEGCWEHNGRLLARPRNVPDATQCVDAL